MIKHLPDIQEALPQALTLQTQNENKEEMSYLGKLKPSSPFPHLNLLICEFFKYCAVDMLVWSKVREIKNERCAAGLRAEQTVLS